MQSLEKVTQNVVANVPAKPAGGSVALAARATPLPPREITKMLDAIDRYFEVKKEPVYGYKPILEKGEAVGQEYDIVDEAVLYTPKADIPQSMREAMLRPALRQHITYHLGRLAAHRRDTRGKEAFEVMLEDLAADLRGVSEWAVVMACTEMRRKDATWYPNSGEIIKIVQKHNGMLEAVNFNFKALAAPVKRGPAVREEDSPRGKEERRKICDFLITQGKPDYFDSIPAMSNYQLEGLARAFGYGKPEQAAAEPGSVAPLPEEAALPPSDDPPLPTGF